jgi:hypothetical protein
MNVLVFNTGSASLKFEVITSTSSRYRPGGTAPLLNVGRLLARNRRRAQFADSLLRVADFSAQRKYSSRCRIGPWTDESFGPSVVLRIRNQGSACPVL